MGTYLDRLNSFGLRDLPDLDEVVLGALELFEETPPPKVEIEQFKHPLVVGSVNAATTGRIMFRDSHAQFANESTYKEVLGREPIDGIVIISASGGKHAIEIAETAKERGIDALLITNNAEAPAKKYLHDEHIHVFPKNREPYTYNTSTYLGMMLSRSDEDPQAIRAFIDSQVLPIIPDNFASYNSFFLIVPPQFDAVQEMLRTKFDELFGPKLVGRIFTIEQAKHAKTVVLDDRECFMTFGVDSTMIEVARNRVFVSMPLDAGFATMIAISYFVIGHIQKQFPPYFKESIVRYADEATRLYGRSVTPIVE